VKSFKGTAIQKTCRWNIPWKFHRDNILRILIKNFL